MQDSQRQTFLQEIFANPEDDTPRLIYADWLDEQGDPRGEFIRIQCELAKSPDRKKRKILEKEEFELLSEHEARWASEALGITPEDYKKLNSSVVFNRGFAEYPIYIPSHSKFLEYADESEHFPYTDIETDVLIEDIRGCFTGNWQAMLLLTPNPNINNFAKSISSLRTSFRPATLDHLLLFAENYQKVCTSLPNGFVQDAYIGIIAASSIRQNDLYYLELEVHVASRASKCYMRFKEGFLDELENPEIGLDCTCHLIVKKQT